MHTTRGSPLPAAGLPAAALTLVLAAATSGPLAAQAAEDEERTSVRAEGTTITVTLSPVGVGGMRAAVTISRADRAENPRVHRFDLGLEGAEAGRRYAAAVHAGHCAAPGELLARLADVDGRAEEPSSRTIVTEDMLIRDGEAPGPMLIRVSGPDGAPLACGDIPEPARLASGGR